MNRRKLLLGASALGLSPALARAQTGGGYSPPVGHPYPSTRLGSRLSHRLSNGIFASSGAAGQTISILVQVPSAPNWVRAVYFNDQATTWPITNASLAMTTAVGTGYNAYNSSGTVADASLFAPITFNNAGADGSPLSQPTGSTYNLTVPANTGSAGQPVLVYSDWIPVTALARTDGGGGFLMLFRTYSSGNVRYSGGGIPDSAIGYSGGQSYWTSGNAASAPFTFSTPSSFPFYCPYGFQYISASEGATIMGVGDSIMESLQTTGANSGFVFRAAEMLSTPSAPMTYFNCGYSGRVSLDYCNDAINHIKVLKPQVVVIQGISQNDLVANGSMATVYSNVQNVLACADYAMQQGAIVVLTTAAPWGASSPGLETYRVAGNALIRAAAAQGFPLLDLDAIWGTGSSPVTYIPAYNSGDSKHPSNAACAAAANVLQPMLAKAVGLTF